MAPKNGNQKLPDKEFKIVVLKMLRDIQENTSKQVNDIRKTIQEKNEKFNKENIKKNHIEIVDLKNIMTELKNSRASTTDSTKQKNQ